MPFDYESFMAGLITGLKLDRPSKNRKPPLPPNSYIITEYEDDIISEDGDVLVTE